MGANLKITRFLLDLEEKKITKVEMVYNNLEMITKLYEKPPRAVLTKDSSMVNHKIDH